jgi:hypothetical protein
MMAKQIDDRLEERVPTDVKLEEGIGFAVLGGRSLLAVYGGRIRRANSSAGGATRS